MGSNVLIYITWADPSTLYYTVNVSINCSVKLGKLDLTIKADTENCHNRTFHKRCKTFVQSEKHI